MKKKTKWTLLLLLVFIIWGSFYPVSKSILSDIHPLLLAFLRYFFALVLLTPLFIKESRKTRLSAIDIGKNSLLGILGVTGFAILLFYGIKFSSSMLSSILANTQPIFAVLLAPAIIGEKFPRKQLPGILLGVLGMILVVGAGGFGEIGFEKTAIIGNLLCILASICICLYYILIKSQVQKWGSLIPTTISFAAGGLLLLLLAIAAGADFSVLSRTSGHDWLLIVYNGMVATAFVYLVHNRSIIEIGVINTIRLKFLIPVFGVLLSILFLHEKTVPLAWSGIIIVVTATIFIQINDR